MTERKLSTAYVDKKLAANKQSKKRDKKSKIVKKSLSMSCVLARSEENFSTDEKRFDKDFKFQSQIVAHGSN